MQRPRLGRLTVRKARPSIAMQVLLFQLGIIALLTVVGTLAAVEVARSNQVSHARTQTLALAETLATAPGIADAVTSIDPTAQLQPMALRVQHSTGVDFVVVMSPAGIRYTHPTPSEIGKHYIGDTAPALAGHPFSETYTGTLGPSVRSVAPIYDASHRIVGLVSVGITLEQLSALVHRDLLLILAIAVGAAAVVALGSWGVARRLRKQTLGLGPQEITRLYEHHDAVLHAMREGLLVVDRHRRVLLANDEAVRLLGLDADPAGRSVAELGLDPALAALLAAGHEAHDETHLAGDRVLAVNQSPARRDGRLLGTVTTLRDHTELRALAGELDSARGFAAALSASAHEAANRLHTVVTMVELGRTQEAVQFATAELAASQQLVDRLLAAVGDPAVVALLLGKASQAAEQGVELSVSDDTAAPDLAVATRDLVTILGNLIDNAIDAALIAPPPRRVAVSLRAVPRGLELRVADSGAGIDPERVEDLFTRGWTTKNEAGHGIGLALVRQSVNRNDGTVEVSHDAALGGAALTVRLPTVAGATGCGAGQTEIDAPSPAVPLPNGSPESAPAPSGR
ncbi:MAG TPA: sensor histidine kinase [Actinocrinis sp.]|jgi:two-component system CitB family sensor kinase|uniref:sensor histidine kinase n=1 Tax=Actinocrinis sp. TaxID=1920516 RepID=UPI002DDD967B|nr:sensor histidine kinase [Actinocrinis sp.]HEV3169732.1 sensor histidine kinase [Actinocrinis sp.]